MINFNDMPLDVSTGYVKIHKSYKVQIDPSEIVWMDEEKEGFRIVRNKVGLCNFLDGENCLLLKQWVKSCEKFHEGRAVVYIENKGYNFITLSGDYISRQCFNSAKSFQNGYGVIEIRGKGKTYIDRNGRLPFPNLYFDECECFKNGHAKVYLKDKGWNFINNKGEIISLIYFDECRDFNDGVAAVKKYGRWCYLHKKGNIIGPFGFHGCLDWENGYGIGWHYFDKIGFYSDKVKYYNIVSSHSEYLFKEKIVKIKRYSKDIFFVEVENYGWNLSNRYGELLSSEYFDKMDCYFKNGFCRVYDGDRWNYLNMKGKLISKIWFDFCSHFREDKNGNLFGRVKIEDCKFKIDAKGNLYPY